MKFLLGRKWHRIPVVLVSVVLALVLVAGGAFAAVVLDTTQTITQTIEEPPSPPDYGTITAPDIALQNLVAGGQGFSGVWPFHVVVELGPDGAGKHLWLELDEDVLYAEYEIKLVCRVTADEGVVPEWTEIIVDMTNGRTSIPLGIAGTYTFDEFINLTTGSDWGPASTAFRIAISDVAAP